MHVGVIENIDKSSAISFIIIFFCNLSSSKYYISQDVNNHGTPILSVAHSTQQAGCCPSLPHYFYYSIHILSSWPTPRSFSINFACQTHITSCSLALLMCPMNCIYHFLIDLTTSLFASASSYTSSFFYVVPWFFLGNVRSEVPKTLPWWLADYTNVPSSLFHVSYIVLYLSCHCFMPNSSAESATSDFT